MLDSILRAAAAVTGLASTCLAATPAPAATDRPVYVCRNAGPVVFSDRPCGPVSEARVLRVHDPGPGKAPSVEPASPRAATLPRTARQIAAGAAGAGPVAADNRDRTLREECAQARR